MPALANATACGTAPSGITLAYCAQLTIQNTQGSTLTSGTQIFIPVNTQALSSNPFATNFNNWVIYNSLTGQTSPAWLEGNSIDEQNANNLATGQNDLIVLKLPDAIAASSSDTNLYFGWADTSTNLYASATANTGEAPQLSATYGQYDNGANVFTTLYQNFAGSSTPSGWGTSGTVTFNNAAYTTSGTAGILYTTSNYGDSSSEVTDWYGYVDNGNGGTLNGAGFWTSGITSDVSLGIRDSSGKYSFETWGGGSSTDTVTSESLGTTAHVLNLIWYGSTAQYGFDYIMSSQSGPNNPSSAIPVGFRAGSGTGQIWMQWVRIRQMPPNNVQPTVSFGTVQSAGGGGGTETVTLTMTSNSVDYGATDTLTATATNSIGNTIQVLYCAGAPCTPNIVFATGTAGSASGTICDTTPSVGNCWAGGTYNVIAKDITSGKASSVGALSINAVGAPLTCNYKGSGIVDGTTYNTLAANDLFSCQLTSLGSQVDSGNIIYAGSIVATGSSISYNAPWDNANDAVTVNSVATANYIANTLSFNLNHIPYSIISNPTVNSVNYETVGETFAYDINITKAAATANFIFTANNVQKGNSLVTVPATDQTFSFPYTTQLLPANNIATTFNGVLKITLQSSFLGGETLDEGTINSILQPQEQNYIPYNAGWKNTEIVEGGSQTLYANITQVMATGLGTVSNSIVKIGSQTINPQTVASYKYYVPFGSFVSNTYGYPAPTVGSPTTIYANTIAFQISYNNNESWRNYSVTPTFTDYLPMLEPCGASYPTNAFTWTFWNASNPTQVVTDNVLFTGHYQIVNGQYTGGVIAGTSAGLSSTATSNVYVTCQYPSWGDFYVNGAFQYSTSNSIQAGYYLLQQTSQPLNNVHLYLSSLLTSISQYDVAVEYMPTLTFVAATVQVLQYIPNTNSSVLIDEFQTAPNSGYVINLQSGTVYAFAAYALNGTFLNRTGYFQAACGSGQTCSFNIQYGGQSQTLLPQQVNNVQYSCGIVNSTLNHSTVTCSFQSINGTSVAASLALYINQSRYNNDSTACLKNLTSASGSLSCTVGNTNTTSYLADFNVGTAYGYYTVWQRVFGKLSAPFADIGMFIWLIGLIVVVCLFVFVNPALGIIGLVAWTVICGWLGFVVVTTLFIGAAIGAAAMVIFTLYRTRRQ